MLKPTWGAGWELQLLLLPRGPSRQCLQQGYGFNCCVFLMPLSLFEMGHWDASFRMPRPAIDIDETASFLFQQQQALRARLKFPNTMLNLREYCEMAPGCDVLAGHQGKSGPGLVETQG